LPLTGAIGGDSLVKISKYLETHRVGTPGQQATVNVQRRRTMLMRSKREAEVA